MAGYAQVTLVGVDLDHVTTSRHDPQAAEYGGTVTLRARSQGIDFTYAYPFSNRTSVLDAIDGATKSLLSEFDSLSRACIDVNSSRAGCDRRGRSKHGRSGGRSIKANFKPPAALGSCMRSGPFLATMLAASSLAAAETPLTINQLLAQGWEIAGYASGYDNRTSR